MPYTFADEIDSIKKAGYVKISSREEWEFAGRLSPQSTPRVHHGQRATFHTLIRSQWESGTIWMRVLVIGDPNKPEEVARFVSEDVPRRFVSALEAA